MSTDSEITTAPIDFSGGAGPSDQLVPEDECLTSATQLALWVLSHGLYNMSVAEMRHRVVSCPGLEIPKILGLDAVIATIKGYCGESFSLAPENYNRGCVCSADGCLASVVCGWELSVLDSCGPFPTTCGRLAITAISLRLHTDHA